MMKLKNTIIKFLTILLIFELLIDILKLVIPAQIQYLEFSYVFTIVRAIFFILLLKELYKQKIKFGFILLTVLLFPIFIQIIQIILGNIFIHFCPQQISDSDFQGLAGLLNETQTNNCPYPTRFDFFPYIEFPIFCIKQIFSDKEFSYFMGLFFSPYIFYFFLFFKFCLFMVFKENSRNPYLSFIPIVNNMMILKICKLPVSWIFFLFIPFVRLFWFFKINKRLSELQNINPSIAIWMTLIPPIFYGKLVFK
ncbi:hypothetical protein [Chryseobacterium sp. RLHN22]|uniref:hypothetical protein n=1 Tax=Chryseobacterium sp. RLHN22 TaxID=3437885 RepID=UPI003D9B62C3